MRQRLGKYELVALLSSGGMAELHLAFAPGPGGFRKVVALKHVLPDLRSDPHFVEMFLDEARLTASLSHPNVGQVFDLGDEDGEYYLAMEFIAGVTVHQLLTQASRALERLPVGFACRVVHDAALGLHHAHSFRDPQGVPMAVIHRDVKPSNIMVSFDGVVKVIDFGIAKARGRLARTQQGTLKGTVPYMSWEQLGDEVVDSRSDLFSLGVVLWELLAGRPLFPNGSIEARRAAPVVELSSVADVSAGLASVVSRALQEDKGDRYATGRELARAIESACPTLFDEGQVSDVLAGLFPDTRAALGDLLALTQRPELDELAIKTRVKALRQADRVRPVERELLTPLPPFDLPAPSAPPAPTAPTETPPMAAGRWVGLAAGLALLGGAGAWAVHSVGLGEARREGPTASPTGRDAIMIARRALVDRDPLTAQQALERCRENGGRCAGLDSVLADVTQALASSPCGSDAAATARVNEASELLVTGARARAVEHLQGCTVGRRTHPAALRALAHLEARETQEATEAPERAKAVAPTSTVHEEVLLGEAQDLVRAHRLDAAAAKLERCVRIAPGAAQCHKLLGSVQAKKAVRDSSQVAYDKARAAYQRYLALVPPTDPDAPKVRRILEADDASRARADGP